MPSAHSLIIIRVCLAFFALQASWEGLTYILGDSRAFDPAFRDKYVAHIALVRTHGVAGALALCLGLLTFARWSRKLGAHLWMGRVYGVAVVTASLTAMPMACMAEGGLSARLAFLLLATCWLFTLLLAVGAARRHRYAQHRRFMTRNYALTYSAVVSRLLLNGLQEAGLPFATIYPVISWTWLIGLAFGEWWLWYSQKEEL
jgi:uncharacterized membrane protein